MSPKLAIPRAGYNEQRIESGSLCHYELPKPIDNAFTALLDNVKDLQREQRVQKLRDLGNRGDSSVTNVGLLNVDDV